MHQIKICFIISIYNINKLNVIKFNKVQLIKITFVLYHKLWKMRRVEKFIL